MGTELQVIFNPEVHPEIVHRCLLAGLKLDIIARIIGIDFTRLNRWMKAYPELQDVEVKALEADAGVVKSLHELATGSWAEDGKPRKPDVIACLFWLKARANWSDQPPPKSAPLTPKDMSLDELRNLATGILGKLLQQEGALQDGEDPPEL